MPIALKILPALSETKSKEDLPPLPWPQVDISLLIPNPSPFESPQITCTVPKWGLKITGVLSEFSYAYSENVEQEISKEVERCYPVSFYQTIVQVKVDGETGRVMWMNSLEGRFVGDEERRIIKSLTFACHEPGRVVDGEITLLKVVEEVR